MLSKLKKNVNLPIIGIIKEQYGDNQVYITPTMKEIDALVAEGVDVIAIDGTKRERPDGRTLEDLMKEAKTKYPNQIFMADISCVEEAVTAEKIGFDIVGTTLVGYTEYTKGNDPVTELEKVIKAVSIPVIGEGNLDTPAKAKRALELGAFAVVVGGAITRPQQITRKFVTEMEKQFQKTEKKFKIKKRLTKYKKYIIIKTQLNICLTLSVGQRRKMLTVFSGARESEETIEKELLPKFVIYLNITCWVYG